MRSRAVFHPSSSFHYFVSWAFSCHSHHHHLRSTFHFCTRSTFPLGRCFALARADSMTTPFFSSVPDTFTYYKTIPFTPLWYGGPSPLTHTLHGALRPPRALPLLCKTAPMTPPRCVIPDVTCIMLVHTTNTADNITTPLVLRVYLFRVVSHSVRASRLLES